MIAAPEKTEVVIKAPELRGAALELFKYPELELGIDGPAGTGKTYFILYFIHMLLLTYPGAKALVCRKRNTDLAGSALATFRESILDEREGVEFFGGSKNRPAGYEYPNGSFMAVNGLDRPGKVKSMDFDLIYINEATDCTLEDVEMCHIRLARRKSSKLPERFQRLLMDFNPDAPTHFLNERMNAGLTRRLLSRHEDNPFLYDAVAQDWTPEGRRYIGELETLTGVRLARYRYGIWAASEGTVYEDSWDRARNVVKPFYIPPEWSRWMWVDFGFTNPFVCAWVAQDHDGRLYVYREIYKTKMIVEDHCTMIKALSRWGQNGGDPFPREVICDHDAEDRATFERHTGLRTTPAHKSVSDGIQAMAARLRPAADGKPRLMYFDNALVERDRDLADRKKPTCTIEEFDSYVWEENIHGIKEQPKKENDHGCLIAGTMIATIHGEKPIETIQAGDYVLTRSGYRRVKASGMTARNAEVFTVCLSNGMHLTGTGNHPIYLNGQGYTPLRSLRYNDILFDINSCTERYQTVCQSVPQNELKPLSTKALNLGATQSQKIGRIKATTDRTMDTSGEGLKPFMLKSGKLLMGLYQRGVISITKTVIHPIMHWRTWNASRQQNMLNITPSIIQKNAVSGLENTWTKYDHRQPHGIAHKRVEPSTLSLGAWLTKKQNTKHIPATIAEKSFNHVICNLNMCAFAPMLASQHGGVTQALITKRAHVSTAEKSSFVTSTISNRSAQSYAKQDHDFPILLRKQEPVQYAEAPSRRDEVANRSIAQEPVPAVAVRLISKNEVLQPVYNLTVEHDAVSDGEYFANGVLVHNCDASRYGVARFDLKPREVAYSRRVL